MGIGSNFIYSYVGGGGSFPTKTVERKLLKGGDILRDAEEFGLETTAMTRWEKLEWVNRLQSPWSS